MIHTSALVADDTTMGVRAVIGPFCVLGFDGRTDPLQLGADAIVRSHVVIYRGCHIGDHFHAGHGALMREDTTAGDRVSIGSGTIVEHHVRLGDDVRLHSGCFVPEHSVLERGVWVGPGVIVTNSRYPARPDSKQRLEGVHIGEQAVIGAGAVLLPGIVVGAEARIGAGAVVVRDVAPGTTVVGNPARATR